MSPITLVWKRKTHQYANGSFAKYNNVMLGSIDYDSGNPPKGKNYKAFCNVLRPAIQHIGHFETEQKAKDAVKDAFVEWLINAGLQPTPVKE